MEPTLREFFVKHFRKISLMPPRRHLRFGLPYNVEKVTEQARFAYERKAGVIFVVRCFATHNEYEKWYKSFR